MYSVYVYVHVCVYNVQFDNIESVIKSMYAAPALAWRGVVWYTGTCSIHHLFPWSINCLYEVHVTNKNYDQAFSAGDVKTTAALTLQIRENKYALK